jgi:XTP/dITP diphosphohydrolase
MAHNQTIYFVSKSEKKLLEMRKLWTNGTYSLESYNMEIQEIQNSDIVEIAKKKAKEAYGQIFRPVLVEHSGLVLPNYGNLPGGLTQIVWDSLTDNGTQPNKFGEVFAPHGETPAIAQSVLVYCDGRRFLVSDGAVQGVIVKNSRGNNGFGWDGLFQPDDDAEGRTFAEMDDSTKSFFSMRTRAMKDFLKKIDR